MAMLAPRHRAALKGLSDDALAAAAEAIGLAAEPLLIEAMEARNAGQLELALALLRGETPRARGALYDLLGGRYRVYPREHPWPRPLPRAAPQVALDERWVATKADNLRLPAAVGPRRPGSRGPCTRTVRVRIGETVGELISRGVERGAIREAVRLGRMTLSSVQKEQKI